jgi:hypothetical protein
MNPKELKIRIAKDTRNALKILTVELGSSSMSNTVAFLIDEYNERQKDYESYEKHGKKKYKIEANMVIHPYLTVWADSKEDAEHLFYSECYSKEEFLETAFPITDADIDELYEEKEIT